jgi:hypothetical protein
MTVKCDECKSETEFLVVGYCLSCIQKMIGVYKETGMNFITSVKDDIDALAAARREGIRDVVRYLMSYKPTTPWGESVAKHFGIDLNSLEEMPLPTWKPISTWEEQRDAYLELTGLTVEQYEAITAHAGETPPHCDSRVIHAPGECEFCDKYGREQQRNRIFLKVAFTNYTPEGMENEIWITTEEFKRLMNLETFQEWLPCPAMYARGKESINSWGGNVAETEETKKGREEYYRKLGEALKGFNYGD